MGAIASIRLEDGRSCWQLAAAREGRLAAAAPRLLEAAFFCYALGCWMGRTNLVNAAPGLAAGIRTFLFAIALICLLAKLCLQRYTADSIKAMLASGALVLVSGLLSPSNTLIWATLFVFAGQGFDIKKLARIELLVIGVAALISFGGAATGLIPVSLLEDRAILSVRSSLGFLHPNQLSFALWMACLSWFVLRDGDASGPFLPACVVCGVADFVVTGSRTGGIMFIVLVAACVLWKRVRGRLRLGWGLLAASAGAGFASYWALLSFRSASGLWTLIDKFMSYRISVPHWYYNAGGIPLIGFSSAEIPHGLSDGNGGIAEFPIDNAYLHLIFRWGFLAFALFMAAYFLTMRRDLEKGGPTLVFLGLALFAVYGLAETVLFQIDANFFLVALSGVLFSGFADSGQSLSSI